MDLKHLISLKIVLFLLSVLTINTSAQICIAPAPVEFNETNKIGETVTTIVIQEGVTLQITANPYDAFGINGSLLVANKVLDYETLPDGGGLTVGISCMKDGVDPLNIRVYVIVKNINDNAPVFANNMYTLQVDELSKVGTSVGKIEATDLDGDRLYYRLESPMEEFGLQTDTNPVILVKKVLDYDTIKEVTLKLFAQDTPLSSPVVHTTSTNIIVSILDINNRPPWFQPCTESIVGTTKICLSPRYTGTVNLNEQAAGPLTLQPGPVHAIDGDKGRNDPIRYTIIEGNTNDTFIIDQQSGAITMQKPVGSASSITLIVMAYELENPDLFATTTVTLQVVISSNHKPQFVKPKYEGFISEDAGVGSLVLESKSTNIPLQVQATDADFSDGINPHIKFEVPVDSDFKITPDGFIIMTRAASPGNVNLQIIVVDATNSESSTASLSVEVIAGVTTTDMPTTTNRPTTTAMNTTMATSTSKTTNMAIDTTTNSDTTRSPYTGVPLPSGDFRTEDMIALGVSLAVALLLCFVVIGFLAYTLRRFNADWRKLTEASIFRSSLSGGSGGPKDGVQYTNEGFQADEDADSLTSKEAAELPLPQGPELNHKVTEILETQHSVPSKSSNGSFTLPTDSSSQNALDNTDNEKEVKPILTKERRMEEGYKAVWFKEDIDPNDKDEVVISERDQDIDHEDDDDDDDFDNDVNGDDNYDDEKEEEDSNFAHL
ncbi:cadherin-related family member 5 isoform X2 [Hemibagrus wyckioides]|uniref:cadherin-related family member 5 isoform X2 n=1 Tax=Hemibagrus wyckioides TaxID=337641 RepID=UPI00266C5AD4|nr:cadherin-related family member 5 isoform X2 [Hemibagrus wyckioides]